MDKTEMIARDYLESLKLGTLVYEPDGNQPPDFLIDGRIAVEVRRLNRHVETPNGPKPIENEEYALLALVQGVLRSFGAPQDNRSWFVSYHYHRPLPPYPEINRALKDALKHFLICSSFASATYEIAKNVEISLLQAGKTYEQMFVLGGHSDGNTAGFVIPDLIKNIGICSAEKMKKISRVKSRYPEWWLVLVDKVSFGIREDLRISHDWDKLILVSPLEDGGGYEVQKDNA